MYDLIQFGTRSLARSLASYLTCERFQREWLSDFGRISTLGESEPHFTNYTLAATLAQQKLSCNYI